MYINRISHNRRTCLFVSFERELSSNLFVSLKPNTFFICNSSSWYKKTSTGDTCNIYALKF